MRGRASRDLDDLCTLHRLLSKNASEVLIDSTPLTWAQPKRWLAVMTVVVAASLISLLGTEPLIRNGSYANRGWRQSGQHLGKLVSGRLELEWTQIVEASHYSITVWDHEGFELADRRVPASSTTLSVPVGAALGVSWRICAWRGSMPISEDRIGVALSHAPER